MTDCTTLLGWLLTTPTRVIAARLAHDYVVAAANGWTISTGPRGRITVRDPRWDLVRECHDCLGTGLGTAVADGCPHTRPACEWCNEPCATCDGHGTIREAPLPPPPGSRTHATAEA